MKQARLLTSLNDKNHVLREPIEVVISQIEGGTYAADAPALGLWCPGLGFTEDDAVADLAEAIDSLFDRFEESDLAFASGYARSMKERLQEYIFSS